MVERERPWTGFVVLPAYLTRKCAWMDRIDWDITSSIIQNIHSPVIIALNSLLSGLDHRWQIAHTCT